MPVGLRRPDGTGEEMKNFVTGALVGLVALAASSLPGQARAGNVGYYTISAPAGCENISPAPSITAAGHTPIKVSTLDVASLAPLQGLVILTCLTGYPGSSVVDAAVADGLVVLIDATTGFNSTLLPGKPALVLGDSFIPLNVSVTPNSDVSHGPGGVLTDDSLDVGQPGGGGGQGSSIYTFEQVSLPTGARPYVFAALRPSNIVAFSYPVGNGTVVFSSSEWMRYLSGTTWPDNYLVTGTRIYYANAIAWMMTQVENPNPSSCASEGYNGTQLTWCKNICENDVSGKTLEIWIQRWINKYRDLPYCAAER